jgi:hypothetical protein
MELNSMRKIALIAFLLASIGVQAAEDTRGAKIYQLLEAQGIQATFDEQMRLREEHSKRSVQIMIDETVKRLKPNASFKKKFNQAAEELFASLQPPWTADEVTTIWANIYGNKFSDEELDQLVAFYTSPVARKETVAGRASLMEFSQYLANQYEPYQRRAIQQYAEKMQSLGKECRCKK